MKNRVAAATLGRDHDPAAGERDLLANGIRVIAMVGEQRPGLIRDQPEQRAEALHGAGFARRQDEAGREAFPLQEAWSFVVPPPRDRPGASAA